MSVTKSTPDARAEIAALERSWSNEERWRGIRRSYDAADVVSLRGSFRLEYTLARLGAERLWHLLHEEDYVHTFGALTGAQAVQMVRAGLQAIYLSGWQVAADGNLAAETYPDQSIYPSNSVPALVRRLNNALLRADQVEWSEKRSNGASADGRYWLAPIVADAEAGFGGPVHAFELMKAMIDAGAAGVHFEDQLAAEKKCGHMGGKVLVPTAQFIRTLSAARLAADVLDVPTLLVARTDARSANLLTSDIDERDREFITGERTAEGYFAVRSGMEAGIARALAYAPYADLLWMETSTPDIGEARAFAEAVHERFPGKMLAYNCSPSFNWERNLDAASIATFQRELGAMGYKFQFITLAGWHMINYHAFDLAAAYAEEGMPAYVRIQSREFARERDGYTATKHQREAGASYFDRVLQVASGGQASTGALAGSTEEEQFQTAG
ncbi:MAG TPA: isocitrate lyase [Gemmatimonadaceae bacterium]